MSTIDLKSLLKTLKLNESTISMILGVLVMLTAGVLVTNFFKNRNENNLPEAATTVVEEEQTTHVVAAGEDLWKIAEKYYEDGYEWSAIADANNITDPNTIEQGQELIIPETEKETEGMTEEKPIAMEPTEEVQEEETVESMEEITETPLSEEVSTNQITITGETYTVKHGDSLWDIAESAYGDGYRWVDIARANDLANPDIIHAGNVLQLPE